jgi:aminoglycoside phosphotransferase (APT) family kinase protein
VTHQLHPDEVSIDAVLVRELLRTQMPELANLDVRTVPAQGTDNVVFRVGSELSVRLPRKPGAVRGLLVEREWLPRLAHELPLPVPLPIASGEPSDRYPFPWTVCTWVRGIPLVPTNGLRSEDVEVLAHFTAILQSLDASGGPAVEPGQRAGPVAPYDPVARTALEGVLNLKAAGRIEPDLVDEKRAASLWAAAVDADAWPGPPVWVHRDLQGGNLLTSNEGRLTGVLDFGGLAVGDPAGNVMAAFHVFSSADRSTFRRAMGVDDSTWVRARGWALVQGLEALIYYFDTHPGMVAMARRVIRAALEPDHTSADSA